MTAWAENPAVYLNGKLMRANDARISPFDHGFLFGDGVFETVRAYGGRVFESSAHFERLAHSAQVTDIDLPFEKDGWDAILDEVVRANGISDAILRVTISRGAGPALVGHSNGPPTVLVFPRPVPPRGPADWERGITCALVDVRTRSHDHLNPEIKCLSYMSNVLALRQARERGADEAIMLNGKGFVAEGSVSNVFGVWGGTLITPPEGDILPGVTRAVVLELARAGGVQVEEKPVAAGRLVAADELFITGTGWEVMPVTFLDGNQIGNGQPGPVTRSLYAAYCRRIASEHGIEHWGGELEL
ncbi:MAG: aminotransferase class IV [Nitrospirota bacterium]|nr:aminotransferase class IV [Nitrospirota bacterium]